jgi:hypothetical protein
VIFPGIYIECRVGAGCPCLLIVRPVDNPQGPSTLKGGEIWRRPYPKVANIFDRREKVG